MKYYIGVDGGGTKTAYALFDENKEMLAMIKSPGSNHENLEGSFDEAADIIFTGIKSLLKTANLTFTDISFTLMGLAGIDHQFQHDALYDRLKAKGLNNFELYNDGFIVVKAGSTGKAAVGYNAGTGTCCNSIDSDGKMLQLGGLSEFSGDEGNGHWIAKETYKMIYDDVYLGIRKTSVTKMFYDEYNITTREEFLSMVSEFEAADPDKFIMRLIDFFFDAAAQGDEATMRVVEEMSERGACLIAAHINQLNFEDEVVEVVLSGSIHTKLPSKMYTDLLMKKAEEKCSRKLKFIKLKNPPVIGCINWIFQQYV